MLLWSFLSSARPFAELALLISVWKALASKIYWPILLPLLHCAVGYCGVLSGLTEVKTAQYRAKLILVFFKLDTLKWEGVCWRCRIDRLGSWYCASSYSNMDVCKGDRSLPYCCASLFLELHELFAGGWDPHDTFMYCPPSEAMEKESIIAMCLLPNWVERSRS